MAVAMSVAHRDGQREEGPSADSQPSTSKAMTSDEKPVSLGKQLWKSILQKSKTKDTKSDKLKVSSVKGSPVRTTKLNGSKTSVTSPSHLLVVQVQSKRSGSKLSLQDLNSIDAEQTDSKAAPAHKEVVRSFIHKYTVLLIFC